jgi:hypothetical protein
LWSTNVTDFEIALEQPSLAYMEEIPLPDPAPFHPAQRSDAADGWSLARTDYLRQRWDEGATGQQISVELGGVSRSAVLGKVRKLGLRGKGSKRGRPALSVAQAQESAAAYASKRGNRHTRKAYAALGDDTSFSRFVKLKGVERKQEPKQLAFDARHPAFIEGRSIFSRKGVRKPADIKNLLVSGHSNVKIGNDVRVGLFKGYRIFTLTLQERATCPRSCLNWTTCYGNNMPYASRVDHTDKVEFERRLETEVETLLRKPWPGILVRLHALGDFFSACPTSRRARGRTQRDHDCDGRQVDGRRRELDGRSWDRPTYLSQGRLPRRRAALWVVRRFVRGESDRRLAQCRS